MEQHNLGGFFPQGTPEFSKWQLDPEDYISNIYNILAGVTYIEDEKGRIIPIVNKEEAQLNEKGIRLVMNLLKFHVHKGIVLSDYDPKEIAKIVQTLHKKLSRDLILGWKEYGAKSPTNAEDIAFEVATNIQSAFKRAKEGNTFERMSKSHLVTESVQKKEGVNSGGFISMFRKKG